MYKNNSGYLKLIVKDFNFSNITWHYDHKNDVMLYVLDYLIMNLNVLIQLEKICFAAYTV